MGSDIGALWVGDVLSSSDELNVKTQSNAAALAARGARLINVGCELAAKDQLPLPEAQNVVMPFLHSIAIQMISYFSALAKGIDVDRPKDLAKPVKVE